MQPNSTRFAKFMISTIILDLDGPILDGKLRHYQCYSDILRENGFIPIPLNEYWEMKRMRIDRHDQLAASRADAIYDTFLQYWMERIEEKRYLSFDRLHPGVLQKLESWRSLGVKLVIVTMRNNKVNLLWQLEKLELMPFFERIITVGSCSGADKANAVRDNVALSKHDSALWVGDTEVDIDAAHELGVKICAVGCGLRKPVYLASLSPDYLVSDLKELNLNHPEVV